MGSNELQGNGRGRPSLRFVDIGNAAWLDRFEIFSRKLEGGRGNRVVSRFHR